MVLGRQTVESRLSAGETLSSIAASFGLTYQTLQYHRRRWGGDLLRPARTSGSTHKSWKGGFFIDRWGYKMVLCPERGKCSKYINGIKLDNRETNLVVVTRAQHRKLHAQLEALAFKFFAEGLIVFSPSIGYSVVPCTN